MSEEKKGQEPRRIVGISGMKMKGSSIKNTEIFSNNPDTERVGMHDGELDNTHIDGLKIADILELSPENEVGLKTHGVISEEIDELKKIITENLIDKEKKSSKIGEWIGKVSAAIAARGIYDNVPFLDLAKEIFPFVV